MREIEEVRRRGGEEKFVAEVLCEGPDCDLALLRVPDDRFWEGVEPLAFSETPLRLREEVLRRAGRCVTHFPRVDAFINPI